MEEKTYNIIAEHGNKKLLCFEPEDECEFMVEGATEEEIKDSFPNFEIKGLDFYLNKYLIMENNVIHVKGPDGVDITKDLYGEDVFTK